MVVENIETALKSIKTKEGKPTKKNRHFGGRIGYDDRVVCWTKSHHKITDLIEQMPQRINFSNGHLEPPNT